MPYRKTPLVNDQIYHIYNRGVEKRNIFLTPRDYNRCLDTICHYQEIYPNGKFSLTPPGCNRENISSNKKGELVEILCYVLMPNHMHLVLKQLVDNGISKFMGNFLNSYVKYFNTKYRRVGPLFQGPFKSKLVSSNEQLIHLSRYIHLNPLVSKICTNLDKYQWTSIFQYTSDAKGICRPGLILSQFNYSKNSYLSFVNDHLGYAESLEVAKKSIF